jgi:SSS family solute:Na+ symporter
MGPDQSTVWLAPSTLRAVRWVHVLLCLYLGVLFVLSRRRSDGGTIGFLLAGRLMTLPALVATLVTTWYGGILGVGEYAYRYGISTWFVFGLPYAIAAVVFAVVLAPRIRRTESTGIPEMLESAYGRPARVVGAAGVWLASLPIAYVLMVGILLQQITDWPVAICSVLGVAVSAAYVSLSGLRAVVRTDALQMVLMYGGFALIVPFAVNAAGGFAALWDAVPPSHRTIDGGLGWQAVAVWYLIALQTVVEPTFYQRILAARSPTVARTGVLVSVGLWFVFDALTVTAGLAARVVVPNLADPLQAFPALADAVLPAPLAAFFTIALLAIVMSTLDSYLFLAGATLGHDFRSRAHNDQTTPRTIRVALLVSAVVAVGGALVFDSVVRVWHHVGTVLTSSLLLPVVAIHLPERWRPQGWAAAAAMVGAGVTAIVWLGLGRDGIYPMGVEPMFPALVVSAACCWPLGRLLRR